MKFDDAHAVEQIAYQIRLADYPRGVNRKLIDGLFNGLPPYTEEEADESKINVNVNFLEPTRVAHDARAQFSNAFLKPGAYFTARTDMGPLHSRARIGHIVSREMNRLMKRSLPYFECFRSKFALNVLHGIGPSAWRDQDHWCPDPIGISDVGIPGRTYLHMQNLPFFYIYKSLTAPELMKLTRGPKIDPGWNLKLVDTLLNWIDQESNQLMGSNWPEVWSPEKAAERIKGDGGFYCGDQVPTIDCFDFYFYDDDEKQAGWKRRMILDSWGTPQSAGGVVTMSKKSGEPYDASYGEFLYNSKEQIFADSWNNVVAFQFADLSAVAPFQYHSVRSLGFLLYSVCHLQNRLRCKFNEAVFEALMMYFRVKSMDDVQRALKLNLVNQGFIDESIEFVKAADRYQVNAPLVQLGIRENGEIISSNSSAYTQQTDYSKDNTAKTKFEVMAEVQAASSLVSTALNQAYQYQIGEYREIARRFMKANSADVDVRNFRAACLRQRVPEKILNVDFWDFEPERVMGAGNKTLEMAIAKQLMEWRPMFAPTAQNEILRDSVMAISDDPAMAERLVPEQPHVSDSIHDTELAFGCLMAGSPVTPKPGLNTPEVIGTMIRLMTLKVTAILKSGGVGTPEDVQGLELCAAYTSAFAKMLAQDKTAQQLVRKFGDAMKNVMNEVKGIAQRQQQAAQAAAQQGQGQQLDPKDAAKIQATLLTAQTKARIAADSHAQRTAQRQVQFEQQLKQEQLRHGMTTSQQQVEHQAQLAATDMEAAAKIQRERAQAEADAQAEAMQPAETTE